MAESENNWIEQLKNNWIEQLNEMFMKTEISIKVHRLIDTGPDD